MTDKDSTNDGGTSSQTSLTAPDPTEDVHHRIWRTLEAAGDRDGALQAAQTRLQVLEGSAAAHADPETASTFDWDRVITLEYLHRVDDAVALLLQREAELPDDHGAPQTTARFLRRLSRWEDALAALDRAIERASSTPMRAELHCTKSDVQVEAGRIADACDSAEVAMLLYEALPEEDRPDAGLAAARRRVERLTQH